jgi:hypothetical protein
VPSPSPSPAPDANATSPSPAPDANATQPSSPNPDSSYDLIPVGSGGTGSGSGSGSGSSGSGGSGSGGSGSGGSGSGGSGSGDSGSGGSGSGGSGSGTSGSGAEETLTTTTTTPPGTDPVPANTDARHFTIGFAFNGSEGLTGAALTADAARSAAFTLSARGHIAERVVLSVNNVRIRDLLLLANDNVTAPMVIYTPNTYTLAEARAVLDSLLNQTLAAALFPNDTFLEPYGVSAYEITRAVPPGTTPQYVSFRFAADYAVLAANASGLAEFVAEVELAVARKAVLPPDSVRAVDTRAGSVVVDLAMHAPNEYTAEQVDALYDALLKDPAGVFPPELLERFGVLAVDSRRLLSDRTGGFDDGKGGVGNEKESVGTKTAGLSTGAIVGIVVGVGGGALVAGGAALWVWLHRRAQRAVVAAAVAGTDAASAAAQQQALSPQQQPVKRPVPTGAQL